MHQEEEEREFTPIYGHPAQVHLHLQLKTRQ